MQCPKIFLLFHSWDHFPAGFAQFLWECGTTEVWNTEMETERIINNRVINLSTQENMEHRLSWKVWKRPGWNLSTKADNYLAEHSWDLSKCYHDYLINYFTDDPPRNLPVTAWLMLQILFSYSLQGPCWSLADTVLSFLHYSLYHSGGCMH